MNTRIGMIGMGVMGRAMATNLFDAGYAVSVKKRTTVPVPL